MQNDDYIIVSPAEPLPGCLVVASKKAVIPKCEDIERNRSKRRYIVRAVVSDHIPLCGTIQEILSRPSIHLLEINGNPLTMYLHHGGKRAVFYDIFPDRDKRLSHIDVEVETDLPSNTLAPARTVVNELLDSLMRLVWMPLVIVRLDLFLKDETTPILHQFLLPFPRGLRLGPLGGIHQFPIFAPYDSLIREAIISNSPYYRFLCAYRLYEGVNVLRRWLKKSADKFFIKVPLPPDPHIDTSLLRRLGFKEEFIKGIRTTNDLRGKFTSHRNRIAHFLFKKDTAPIHFSHGITYNEYALGGAILLHYAHKSVTDLIKYFHEELGDKLRRGSILPLKEQREMFIIKPEDYWPSDDRAGCVAVRSIEHDICVRGSGLYS